MKKFISTIFKKEVGHFPKVIFFIDDRESNLKSVSNSIQKFYSGVKLINIEYRKCMYTKARLIGELEFLKFWNRIVKRAKFEVSGKNE